MSDFVSWLKCARWSGNGPESDDAMTASSAELGLTVVELLITAAIVATLSAIVIPTITDQVKQDKNQQAASDIAVMGVSIAIFINDHGVPPDSLAQVGLGGRRDPWGNLYRYLNVVTDGHGPPHPRKDHFLHPLNSDYDLYSMGADGDTQPGLTAAASRDDIVRASNGGFIGLAAGY